MIIEDKNGDQWVVHKDATTGQTKVSKVEGGGLVVGPDGKILDKKTLRKLDKMILASLTKYKKVIDDYQASIKQTQPSKGGGPSLFEWELEMYYAELPQCLSEHKDKFSDINSNLATLVDPESSAFFNFALNVGKKISEGDNATQEKVDGVVCESLIDVQSYVDDLNCNPLVVPKSLRDIAARAKPCDNDVDDDLEEISNADLAKLCIDQRIDLIKCLDDFPAQGGDDEVLIKLLKTTPTNHRIKLMSRLQDEKIYQNRLIEAVDGEEFIELVNTISQWMGTPKQTDWENAVVSNKFLFFDGDDAFSADFNGTGIIFKTRKNFTIGWYQEVTVKPHEFVAVTFTNDFIAAGKEFKAGTQVTMSGIAVWSLFNEMFNKRLRAGGAVALDIPLLFVGVGEVTALRNVVGITRAIRALRYARATANIVIAAGGLVMASGIEDELTLTAEGREILQYWTWFNLIYAGGTLTPHAITSAKGLYSSCKNMLTRPGLSEGVKNTLKVWMETLKDIFKKNGQSIDDAVTLTKYGQKLEDIGEVLENGLVKGKYSQRVFDPNKAGGAILSLDWKNATITKEGIEIVKKHLSRFGKSSQNEKAIKRLEDILEGKTPVTDFDKRFYTHELREYERYKALGIADGVNDAEAWGHAHAGTLEDFRLNERTSPVYHPDTEPSIDDLLREY